MVLNNIKQCFFNINILRMSLENYISNDLRMVKAKGLSKTCELKLSLKRKDPLQYNTYPTPMLLEIVLLHMTRMKKVK